MLNRVRYVPILLLSLSCATTRVVRVGANDHSTEGVRFWLSAPHLIVTQPVLLKRVEALMELDPKTSKLSLVQTAPVVVGPTEAKRAPPFEVSVPAIPSPPGGEPAAVAGPAPRSAARPVERPVAPAAAEAQPKAAAKAPSPGAAALAPDVKPTAEGAVAIVWLPDYCQQYAISQANVLSTASMKLALEDGWRLSSLDTAGNSTELLAKIVELAGTAIGAGKDLAVARTQARDSQEEAARERAPLPTVRRITSTHAVPGIYPLFKRASCAESPAFKEIRFRTEESVEYQPVN